MNGKNIEGINGYVVNVAYKQFGYVQDRRVRLHFYKDDNNEVLVDFGFATKSIRFYEMYNGVKTIDETFSL